MVKKENEQVTVTCQYLWMQHFPSPYDSADAGSSTALISKATPRMKPVWAFLMTTLAPVWPIYCIHTTPSVSDQIKLGQKAFFGLKKDGFKQLDWGKTFAMLRVAKHTSNLIVPHSYNKVPSLLKFQQSPLLPIFLPVCLFFFIQEQQCRSRNIFVTSHEHRGAAIK